jgi:DNA-binding transcriptional LysR family regulator
MPAPPGGLLAAAIRFFRADHGDLALAVVELDDDEQATALAEGRVDVALTWERPVRSGLTAELLLTEPTVALLPPGHPLAGAASFPVGAFTDGPLLFPVAERSHCWAQLETLAGGAGVRLDPIPTAPSAVTDLVAAGLGISAVPGSFSSSGRSDVAFVPVPGLVGEMSVLWRDEESDVLVLDFLHACRAAAREQVAGRAR